MSFREIFCVNLFCHLETIIGFWIWCLVLIFVPKHHQVGEDNVANILLDKSHTQPHLTCRRRFLFFLAYRDETSTSPPVDNWLKLSAQNSGQRHNWDFFSKAARANRKYRYYNQFIWSATRAYTWTVDSPFSLLIFFREIHNRPRDHMTTHINYNFFVLVNEIKNIFRINQNKIKMQWNRNLFIDHSYCSEYIRGI